MFQFAAPIASLLSQAGWYQGREIDITDFKQELTVNGFTIPIAVEKFLTEFGRLNIIFLRAHGTDTVHFDAKEAVRGVDPLWAQKDYKTRLANKNLCIIGEAYSNHLTLMMDEDGAVYGGYDDFLCFIANSGREAIEAICLRLNSKEIPYL
ncbi:SUKH-3 immunity protein [Mucilaginibacter gossypiicola]|uniref:SUKH-3 immunity protein n=1 Tax=Mucilaginibacter gossypiicola TaxID=551995 RepID=A0A1H8SEC9_9SPHI|nr:SUKH-3 domain-containing protein [Mucilaginibacter gossypiicola]SEO76907.1 SUKH-3 immunity protein [Mucilaginibacter gossypiicola]